MDRCDREKSSISAGSGRRDFFFLAKSPTMAIVRDVDRRWLVGVLVVVVVACDRRQRTSPEKKIGVAGGVGSRKSEGPPPIDVTAFRRRVLADRCPVQARSCKSGLVQLFLKDTGGRHLLVWRAYVYGFSCLSTEVSERVL